MRSRLISVLALGLLAPLAHAAKPVNIAQLEQMLSADLRQSDGYVAGQLGDLTLTERVSTARLTAWRVQYPGRHTQQALLLLADESAFLPLPASDVSPDPPPAHPVQEKIFAAALEYAIQTIHNLPNLFAVRETLYFQASLRIVVEQARNAIGITGLSLGTPSLSIESVNYLPLHLTQKSRALVTYRDGNEVHTDHALPKRDTSLTTTGEFGPILSVVLGDAAHNSIVWGYWQQHGDTRLAVFRYQVSADKSHYQVESSQRLGLVLQSYPAYRGEIAVDPATGSISRISIVSQPAVPVESIATGILVEYGSIILGNRSYIVPLHGVALTRQLIIPNGPPRGAPPVQTCLNDVAFTRYRLFRAEALILSAEDSRHLHGITPTTPAYTPQ